MAQTKDATLRPIPKNCQEYGCSAPAYTGNYCDAHRKSHKTQARKDLNRTNQSFADSSNFYNSNQWRKLRQMVLRGEPLCRTCGRAAHDVDHIIPIRKGGARSSLDNLQALCKSCHAKKSRSE